MIRSAKSQDGEVVANINSQAREAAMSWLPTIHPPEDVVRYFSEVVIPKEHVDVFTQGQEVVGFIAVANGWVNHLYVAPAAWGRGIGSSLLLRHQEAWGELQLWTFQRNAKARAFYVARGFREEEFTDGQSNEEKTPDVKMVWQRGPYRR